MKYTLKNAHGLFRIRRKVGTWEIRKTGTTIPRDTVRPLRTFADIYRAFHALEAADTQDYTEEGDE